MSAGHANGGHLWHLVIGMVPVASAGMAIALDQVRGRNGRGDDRAVRPATQALLSPTAFGVRTSPVVRAGPRVTARRPSAAQIAAVGGCVAAALLHAAVMPDHFQEAGVYGAFFAVAVVAQLAAAWLLWHRPTPGILRAVAAGSIGVVGLWAWTRAVGVPLGPDAGQTEAVGLVDVVCASAELITVLGCLALLARDRVADSAGWVISPLRVKATTPYSR